MNDEFGFVSYDDVTSDQNDFGFISFDAKSRKKEEEEEGFWKSASRTALQIPQGILEGTLPGMIAGAIPLVGMGEALDPEEIEHIKKISEREGIPFDEEKYMQAVQGASEAFPTVSNIARGIESKTGLPLEAKTPIQKGVNILSTLIPTNKVKVPELNPKHLSSEGEVLRKTGEEFGLRKFSGMETEKPPKITPIVSKEKQVSLKSELDKNTKQAIDQIIEQKIPIKKMKDMGIDLENAYETGYAAARKTASDMGNKQIDFSNVIEWIDKEISKTKDRSLNKVQAKV